jgi:hypothetical protein
MSWCEGLKFLKPTLPVPADFGRSAIKTLMLCFCLLSVAEGDATFKLLFINRSPSERITYSQINSLISTLLEGY